MRVMVRVEVRVEGSGKGEASHEVLDVAGLGARQGKALLRAQRVLICL